MALLLASIGCQGPLPRRDIISAEETLGDVRRSIAAVHTLSSPCRLELTRGDGASVRLDGAIAARFPDYFRVRAWKMSHAALDLTVTPAGVWVLRGANEDSSAASLPAIPAERMTEAWRLLANGPLGPEWSIADSNDDMLIVSRHLNGAVLYCKMDRSTRTVRGYRLMDDTGRERMRTTLERYRSFRGIPWPLRITSRSDAGSITIVFDDPEINVDLPPAAFTPPQRAEKLP